MPSASRRELDKAAEAEPTVEFKFPRLAPFDAGQTLCGKGQFPFHPRVDIVRPRLRRVLHALRGDATDAEMYLEPFFDQPDLEGYKHSPVYDAKSPRGGGRPDDGRHPYDLRQALLDAFSEDELEKLGEIVMDVGRVPSAITSDDTRREFGHKAVGYGQVVQAATGTTRHETLLRVTSPSELHRISEKRQFDPSHADIDRMLVGLTIRVEREIYGIAERFLAPSVEVTRSCFLLDSSQELGGGGGGGGVPHQCLGRTRVFGWLGWEEDHKGLLEQILRNHTPFVLATDELTNPGDITAIKKIRDSGVRLVATTHDSFQDLLLYRDQRHLLGGLKQVVVTDETAKEKAIFSKIRLQRNQALLRPSSPMFETVVEVLGKLEYRIIHDVQKNVDLVLSGDAIQAEKRFVDAGGMMFAKFEVITFNIVA
ncbi:hypothetical protein BDZ88DRAFT_450932 [Geranomyces variabilis]|nr:hypothetical protein BDZ88DRAFT_450932 [Geranomyces variabilis]